ncbi:hypothetical protein ABG809_01180 [Streptococcus iniae]
MKNRYDNTNFFHKHLSCSPPLIVTWNNDFRNF